MSKEQRGKDSVKELREGFTWKSVIGILYVSLILLPANIYYILVVGQSLGIAAQFITLILFVEIFKFSAKPLTKQEAFVIYAVAIEATAAGVALAFVGNAYFRVSPIAESFGIASLIPNWWAPPADSPAILNRVLFHSDWALPILVLFGSWTLGKVIDFTLATYLYQQLAIEEDLPFPSAYVGSESVLALTDPEYVERRRFFIICSIIGLIYGFIAYAIPLITSYRITLIRVPFYDFTPIIENWLPGASFGLTTDIFAYAFAFFMPHKFIVFIFIASLGLYFVGNHFLVQNGLFPYWMKGMGLGDSYVWSFLSYWASPIIGLSIAAAVVPLVTHREHIIRAFKSLRTPSTEARAAGIISAKLLLTLFFSTTIVVSLLAWFLSGMVPYYLLVIFLVSVVWSFLFAQLAGRAMAEYGFDIGGTGIQTYFVPMTMIASGARSINLWFVQPTGFTVYSGGASLSREFKVATLCGAKPSSYYKAWFFVWFLAAGLGMIYTQIFWSMAPIPSSAYPASAINYPAYVAEQSLWISTVTGVGGGVSAFSLKPDLLFYGFSFGVLLAGVSSVAHVPFSLIGLGLLAGTRTWISTALAFLIGIFIARYVRKKMGQKWWDENRFIVPAGLLCGVSLSIGLGVVILLIRMAVIGTIPY